MKHWYKQKKYLHFDFALNEKEATTYVTSPDLIAKHRFSPLIHYNKVSRQYKHDKKTGELTLKRKDRNLFYVSHVDGYIYAYYSKLLSEKYENYLRTKGISDVVSSYRSIQIGEHKASNIHFANEAFEYLKSTTSCKVLCLDLTKFFDNIATNALKKNWARVLSADESVNLPTDHYKVFKSLAGFHYVEERDIHSIFNLNPRKPHSKEKMQHSTTSRICTYAELRKEHRTFVSNKGLIRNKKHLKINGIPQGTPISGLLSNIFLIDFDIAIAGLVRQHGGYYRRYCDDIFIAFPDEISFAHIENRVRETLRNLSENQVEINEQKTERHIYRSDNKLCYDESGKKSTIQYLGFIFDGEHTYIRSSSISRSRSRIHRCIVKNLKGKIKKDNFRVINTRKVYQSHSTRKITPRDANTPRVKGFISYANKSSKVITADKITSQLRRNDTIIRKAINKYRNF